MNYGLSGKKALVTGGSHGIGRAIALALAAEGCDVAICSRDNEKLASVKKELEHYNITAISLPCDVLVKGDIERVMTSVMNTWGGVDILINNVGGGGRWGEDAVEETDPEVWGQVYQKNAGAAIAFTAAALPFMKQQRWGRVVTIASIYGKEGGGRPWFAMAKSAEISFMKSMALNPAYARAGITFNTVAPGHIAIPGTGSDQEKKLAKSLPLGRMGIPEEVAAVVAFLCSEQARLVNGACIAVDGGQSRSF